MLCVTRKRFAAARSGRSGRRAQIRDRALGVVVAGVQSRAERRRAEIQLEQLLARAFDVSAAACATLAA